MGTLIHFFKETGDHFPDLEKFFGWHRRRYDIQGFLSICFDGLIDFFVLAPDSVRKCWTHI
jgi:hypothetical protein